MNTPQRIWLEAVSPLSYANPFLPERIELESKVLGNEFLADETVWSYRLDNPNSRVNIGRIMVLLSEKLPISVNGVTVSRYCASSLETIRAIAAAG